MVTTEASRPETRGGPHAPGAAAVPDPAGGEPAWQRIANMALLLSLAAGALLRLLQYAVGRSLWLDEALVASSILGRDAAGLFRPLDYGQTAPTGFLLLVKGVVTLLGTSELALRLVPLLFGMAALALVLPVARRYLSPAAVPLAVALFALAPYLVYYASELKQYSGDALVSLAVLATALPLARGGLRPRDLVPALLVGVLGVWISQPAVFMLAGTGLVLGTRALRAGDRRRVALLAAVGAAWAVSFAGAYLVARRALADPAYMQAFWRSGFAPLPPRSLTDWTWLPRALARAFREPMGIMGQDDGALSYVAAGVLIAAFAAGCAAMLRGRRLELALLLAPLGLALAASLAHLYPFGADYLTAGRVLIFLIPAFAFVAAEGVAAAARRAGRGRAGYAVYAALAAAMLAPSASYAVQSVPHLRAEVKPLLLFAQDQRQPGDLMYVYYNGQSVFRYYGPRFGWAPAQTVQGTCSRLDPIRYLGDIERLRGTPRVWFLFVDGKAAGGYDERKLMVDYLDRVGRRLDDRVAVGASLYLYDLRPGNARPGPFSARVPKFKYDASLDCRGPWAPR